ncbi:LLM class flavin-dependent oxidoreductase [Aldersonia kunmingensis]|uniref:LLM class flavin-dependent oxidoreductase n=1 Tax=Aldersonia kunmingensis TaxID=408066 RepID=UPI0008313D30|nr:LLM class flavin-dependent oxidoreductase [Aldersonia kunmingensis]
MTDERQLHLNLFIMGAGHHEAAWLAHKDPSVLHRAEHFVTLAQAAERARFDAVFIADSVFLTPNVELYTHEKFDPISVLGVLAASTSRIGLIGTATTSFSEPYNLARQFASLDHLSGGRVGWNIVTTADEDAPANFGGGVRASHEDRYRRATEFVEVVQALWDSWADDALVRDTTTKRYVDLERIRRIEHDGEFFSVRGPLNIPRPPQGHPVLVQAGASPAGLDFAAQFAEVVFTAQYFRDDAVAFAEDLRRRTAAAGRPPDATKVLPGLIPVLGSTEAEVRALEDKLEEFGGTAHSLQLLGWLLGGIELTEDDLDRPVPFDRLPREEEVGGQRARFALLVRLAQREQLTVRQLARQIASGHGHRVVAGTPAQVADDIEQWFRTGAADGFNIMPPVFPDGLDTFADHVVPLLQQRGIFRRDYAGETLREHLGLARPEHVLRGPALR